MRIMWFKVDLLGTITCQSFSFESIPVISIMEYPETLNLTLLCSFPYCHSQPFLYYYVSSFAQTLMLLVHVDIFNISLQVVCQLWLLYQYG